MSSAYPATERLTLRRVFLSAVMLLLAGLMAVNFFWLQAEYFAIPARYLFRIGDTLQPGVQRDASYRQALLSIERALRGNETNPQYREMQARLLMDQCKTWDRQTRETEWQQCQQSALVALRTAIQGNPQWAYNWANLLLVKTNLQQFDDEFYQALQESQRLGGHEYVVNQIVALVGLQEWERWSRTESEPFRQALLNVQKTNPGRAAWLASQTGRTYLYCWWTDGDARQFRRACRAK